MKSFLIIQILLLLINFSYSQEIFFGFGLGYAGDNQDKIKEINNVYLQEWSLPMGENSNFEPQIYYETELGMIFNNYGYASLVYNFLSIGGRISHEDYSGWYYIDHTLNTNQFGLKGGLSFFKTNYFRVGFFIEAGRLINTLTKREVLKVYEYSEELDLSMKATSTYLRPGLDIHYGISFIELGASVSYLFDGQNKFENEDGSTTYVFHPYLAWDEIESNWCGIRASAHVNLNFNKLYKIIFKKK